MDNRNDDRDQQMERDTEIRRETDVSDALGPVEGTFAERNAAESALSPEERRDGQTRATRDDMSGVSRDPRGAPAHVERGAHSDESLSFDDRGDARNEEGRE